MTTYEVRDQGELLTGGGIDYDIEEHADGSFTIQLVAEAGEPLTVGVTQDGLHGATLAAEEILVNRGPLDSAEVDASRFQAIYANALGIWTRRRPVREIWAEVVAGGLGFVHDGLDGVVRTDVLVPPTSPSPRDGACLEISSPTTTSTSRLDWGLNTVIASTTFTVAAWVKTHRRGPTDTTSQRVNVVDTAGAGDFDGYQFAVNLAFGVPRLELERWAAFAGSPAVRAQAGYSGFLGDGGAAWHFLAAVNDESAGEVRFYAAQEGGTLALVGTHAAALGFVSPPPHTFLAVGGVESSLASRDQYFRGATFEPQVWSDALTLSELQDLMDDAPAGTETGLEFFAPLDGLAAASTTDTVTATAATVFGDVREVPDLVLDLTTDPKVFRSRKFRPAHTVEVEYRRNFAVLDAANIAATVSQEEALDLQTEARFERWSDPEIADDYLDAREVTIPTLWATQEGARATLRLGRYRFAPARELADLLDAGRRALLLTLGAEVRVYGSRWDLEAGPVYRVASNNRRFAALTCDLGLWR